MFDAFAAVRFFFPCYFQLLVPNKFHLCVKERNAVVILERRVTPIEVLDFANKMIPDPGRDNRLYTLENPISGPSRQSVDLTNHMYPFEDGTRIAEVMQRENRMTAIPHHFTSDFTIDSSGLLCGRVYETRHWTEVTVIYEIEEGEEFSDPDFNLFLPIFDYFISSYRVTQKDSKVLSLEEVPEPLFRIGGVSRFSKEELAMPPHERLGKPRKIVLNRHSVRFPDTSEKYFGSNLQEPTMKLKKFLKENSAPSFIMELMTRSRQALRNHQFRYAVLDSFIAVETAISGVLNQLKLNQGVSRKRHNKYGGIVYKIKTELPTVLHPLSQDERDTLGRINQLRILRNAIIHEGKSLTQTEAQEGVNSSEKLLDLFITRGYSL